MNKILSFLTILIMSNTNIFAQQDTLSHLDDDFNNAVTLKNWLTHHETEGWPDFTIKKEILEQESVFYLEPATSGWYGEFHRSPFYFKLVSGNFTVITKVKATGLNTLSPTRGYSLAGLMVRSSRPVDVSKDKKGYENWMFLSTGSATKKGKPQFESKNTVKGKSKLKVFPSKQGWVYLSISRIGNKYFQCYKYEGETTWTLLRVLDRPDFPNELQIGMLAYTDFWPLFKWFLFKNTKKFNTQPLKGKPDLIAKFDFVKFRRPNDKSQIINTTDGFYNSNLKREFVTDLDLE